MPPKSRIDEKAFQKALQSLRIDELHLLDSSTSTGGVWGRLCIEMSKPDNIENRRACYDAWKKKRYNSHDIVSSILQEVQQSTNIETVQNEVPEENLSCDEPSTQQTKIGTHINITQSTSSTPTTCTATTNDNQLTEIPVSGIV
ncbi:unnamed protein product [Adineta steineri]|uniref:Uncharacterized protein n=1 Tax=Adineta steineri TaxID=433720 RepID=A0A815IFG4_9BILA|nr:unnamed protein product [Adineta steineri]CAF1364708.1 unnamed protein product [Adineta steineri]